MLIGSFLGVFSLLSLGASSSSSSLNICICLLPADRWCLPCPWPTLPGYAGHSDLWLSNSWSNVASSLLRLSHTNLSRSSTAFSPDLPFVHLAASNSSSISLSFLMISALDHRKKHASSLSNSSHHWSKDWIIILFNRWEQKNMANYTGKLITDLELIKHKCLFLSCFLCLFPLPLLPSFKLIFIELNSEPASEDKMANNIDMAPILKRYIITERWVLWGKQWCTLREKEGALVLSKKSSLRWDRAEFLHHSTNDIWGQIRLRCGCCPLCYRMFSGLYPLYSLDCPKGTTPFIYTDTFENHWPKVWIS